MRLMNKEVDFVKVLRINHLVEEATGEAEDDMKSLYTHVYPNEGQSFILITKRMTNLKFV